MNRMKELSKESDNIHKKDLPLTVEERLETIANLIIDRIFEKI